MAFKNAIYKFKCSLCENECSCAASSHFFIISNSDSDPLAQTVANDCMPVWLLVDSVPLIDHRGQFKHSRRKIYL